MDASHNIILNTNNIDRFFINDHGDVSIGENNRTHAKGSFYVKDINQTLSSNPSIFYREYNLEKIQIMTVI